MSLSLSFISIHHGLEAEDFCNPVKGQLHWIAEQNGLIVIEAHSGKDLIITEGFAKLPSTVTAPKYDSLRWKAKERARKCT